ncbi:MAG: hypothetical protein PUG10_06195 [Lachnospiraceae bacterium]|nr:hypothetical protein [Lachnospiraceae bacterium]
MNDNGCKNLANAIIYQAYRDLKHSALLYKCKRNTIYSDKFMRETLDFFYSQFFNQLTDIDSNRIIRRVLDEVSKTQNV